MNPIFSFPPLSDSRAEVLILGSMPGRVSLEKSQYYAHPQNLFWKFMQEIAGIPIGLEYLDRCQRLKERRIALWDVLKTCLRSTSLDSDIDDSTLVPNDFTAFFQEHPKIQLICFNGSKSDKVFNQSIAPCLGDALNSRQRIRLPSTSPANASISFETKLEKWRVVSTYLDCAES